MTFCTFGFGSYKSIFTMGEKGLYGNGLIVCVATDFKISCIQCDVHVQVKYTLYPRGDQHKQSPHEK